MNKKTVALALGWLAWLAILVGDVIRRWTPTETRLDFGILFGAAQRFAGGGNMYDIAAWAEHTKPPLAVLPFLPFVNFPPYVLSNILTFVEVGCFFWLLGQGTLRWKTWRGLFVAFALLAFFIAELKRGQYNVLLLSLAWMACRKDSYGGGFALAMAVLFKPTNILFAFFVAGLRFWRVWLGATLTALSMSCLYVAFYGLDSFVALHREYLAYLPLSEAKHLLRADNFGLPSVWASLGLPGAELSGKALLLLSSGMAVFWGWKHREPEKRWEYFGWVSLLGVVATPMAWMQNYVGLLPLLCVAVNALPGFSWRRVPGAAWCLAVYFAITQLLNYEFLGAATYDLVVHYRYLLWSLPFLLGALKLRSAHSQR